MAKPGLLSRAILLPTALIFGLIGVILTLYGGIKMFRLSGADVARADLTQQLALYTDCEYRAQATGNITMGAKGPAFPTPAQPKKGGPGGANTTGGKEKEAEQHIATEMELMQQQMVGGAFADAVTDWCQAQQRPYMYLFILTALMVFLSLTLAICAGWKASRGFLHFFNFHNAVTLALLFVSIYAMMHATKELSALRDCGGFDQATVARLQSVGIICYNAQGQSGDQPRSRLPDYIWSNILACFYIGIAFSILAVGLLAMMSALSWWAKHRAAYAGPATGGPSLGHREPYYYSEEERRRAAAPTV